MQAVVEQALTEIRGAWRFRWKAVMVAWVLALIGLTVVFLMPDQFEADAKFYVDATTRIDEALEGVLIDAEENSQIALVREMMLSGPVLEQVARETDLDLRANTLEEKEALITQLARRIEIRSDSTDARARGRNQDDGVFEISFRDTEQQKALAIVDTLLDTFREDVVRGRTQGSEETVEFLQKEIARYAEQLRTQEQELADFKRENVGLLPGEGGGYFETMQKALADARLLEAERSVLVDRRTALLQQMRGQDPIIDGDAGIGVPQNDLESRIEELEANIEEMLTRYTDKWPDVIAARDQLQQLYERRDRELAELAGSENGVASNNPVYQQLQITLNETDLEITEVEGRLAALRAQIADLQARVDVIPEIEARLSGLTRDYEQIRNVYGELRERLEREQLRRSRLGWDGVTFQVIEPPQVSLRPVAPMRSELILLVFVAALAIGGGVAWLLHQLKPVFIDASALRSATGLPVLGSVSMTWQTRHRAERRHELKTLIASLAGIVVIVVLALVFKDIGVEAAEQIRRIASL